MIPKLLSWIAVGLTLAFTLVSCVALFANAALGTVAPLVIWIGFGMLGIAVLLAIAILVMSAMNV